MGSCERCQSEKEKCNICKAYLKRTTHRYDIKVDDIKVGTSIYRLCEYCHQIYWSTFLCVSLNPHKYLVVGPKSDIDLKEVVDDDLEDNEWVENNHSLSKGEKGVLNEWLELENEVIAEEYKAVIKSKLNS